MSKSTQENEQSLYSDGLTSVVGPPHTTAARSSTFKRVERWILLACVGLVLIGYALTKPLQDFVEYWTSAHELVGGRDPYSLTRLFQLQKALGWSKAVPLMNLTPPWALPLIAPLGLARSYVLAWIVWVSVLAFGVWWCTRVLLTFYGNGNRIFPSESYASEAILGFTFLPSLVCLKFAQVTPFALLGLTSFLWFENRRRYALAGLCLALAAIKPQLLYLVWLAVLLWCLQGRKWKTILSFLAGLAGLTAVAVLMRPGVMVDYWRLSQSGYMRVWPSAFGAILRFPFGTTEAFPLQFVAPLLGTVWFCFYWRRHGRVWDWKERMPMLITVSVLTTSYGWTFDQVLLVIPIVAIAAHYAGTVGMLPQKIARAYTAVNLIVFLCLIFDPALPFIVAPLSMALLLVRLQGDGTVRLAYAYRD